MKNAVFLISLVIFGAAQAASDLCAWDGEEYLRDAVQNEKLHWLQAVHRLHISGSEELGDFEGLGSCRFVPRRIGVTAKDVVDLYAGAGISPIVATRAYAHASENGVKIVVAGALYSETTNYLFVERAFYSSDRPICQQQRHEMLQQGRQEVGVPFVDIQWRRHHMGGISAVINEGWNDVRYLGVCHFHPLSR